MRLKRVFLKKEQSDIGKEREWCRSDTTEHCNIMNCADTRIGTTKKIHTQGIWTSSLRPDPEDVH